MFTLDQIKKSHSKMESGADFPQYIKELFSLGILEYSIYVYDGHAEYKGKEDCVIFSEAEYSELYISSETNSDRFKDYLKIHQQGGTDYQTFCKNSAETGIYRWKVDIFNKTCTYYDSSNNIILREEIPI